MINAEITFRRIPGRNFGRPVGKTLGEKSWRKMLSRDTDCSVSAIFVLFSIRMNLRVLNVRTSRSNPGTNSKRNLENYCRIKSIEKLVQKFLKELLQKFRQKRLMKSSCESLFCHCRHSQIRAVIPRVFEISVLPILVNPHENYLRPMHIISIVHSCSQKQNRKR